MRSAILAGMAALAAIAGGCTEARSEGGPKVERDYQVGNFDRIELAGAYDVKVRTGTSPSVHASGNQSAIDRLVIEVRNGVLSIRPRKENGFHIGLGRNEKVTLAVTVPMLRAADLAGAGDIQIDRVSGERFEVTIAGAGDLTLDRLDVGSLKIDIAGSGDAHLRSGRARSADYSIAGSGDIDAKGLATETASISVAGAGDVSAHATRSASVDIMGAGDVELTGGAKCKITKAGVGDVRCS